MTQLQVLVCLFSVGFARSHILPSYDSDVVSSSGQLDGSGFPCQDEQPSRVAREVVDYPINLDAMLANVPNAENIMRGVRSSNNLKLVEPQAFVNSQPIEPINMEAVYMQPARDEVKIARSVFDVPHLAYPPESFESSLVQDARAAYEGSARSSRAAEQQQLSRMYYADRSSQVDQLRYMRSTPFIQVPLVQSQSVENCELDRAARAIGVPVQVSPVEVNLDDSLGKADQIPKPSTKDEMESVDEPKQPRVFALYYVKTQTRFPLSNVDDFDNGSKNDQKVDSNKDADKFNKLEDEEKLNEFASHPLLQHMLAFAQLQNLWYQQFLPSHNIKSIGQETNSEGKPSALPTHTINHAGSEVTSDQTMHLEKLKKKLLIVQLELQEISLKESLEQVQQQLKELKIQESGQLVDSAVTSNSTSSGNVTVSSISDGPAPVALGGGESVASSSA